MADIKQSSLELIGGTPILKLNNYTKKAGISNATILAKLNTSIRLVQLRTESHSQ